MKLLVSFKKTKLIGPVLLMAWVYISFDFKILKFHENQLIKVHNFFFSYIGHGGNKQRASCSASHDDADGSSKYEVKFMSYLFLISNSKISVV